MKIAVFDFDGTIYKHETFSLLMSHLKMDPEYSYKYNAFYRSIILPFLAYKMHLYSETKMKENLMQKYLHIFKEKPISEITHFFDEIALTMQESFHPIVIQRLEEHHHNGFHVMVVSGAYTPLLETALQHLPIDTIIGTEIPLAEGIYDPTQRIDHVQATRKAELIIAATQHTTVNWEESYAYGDSYADVPVLKMVGNPVAVYPDKKLQTITYHNEWQFIC